MSWKYMNYMGGSKEDNAKRHVGSENADHHAQSVGASGYSFAETLSCQVHPTSRVPSLLLSARHPQSLNNNTWMEHFIVDGPASKQL